MESVWIQEKRLNPLSTECVYKQKKRPNSLNRKCVWKHGNDQILWIRNVSKNMETTNSFEYGMCQKTWKRPNPLNTESVKKHGNDQILWVRNVSGNMETTNSFQYGVYLETWGTTKSFEYRNNDLCDTHTQTAPIIYKSWQWWPIISTFMMIKHPGAGWQKLAGFRRAQNNPSELS